MISSVHPDGFPQDALAPKHRKRAGAMPVIAVDEGEACSGPDARVPLGDARYFDPRLRLIATASISLPGEWIEIDCWLLRVLTASSAENTGLLARRLIWPALVVPEIVPMAPRVFSLQVPEIAPALWLTLLLSTEFVAGAARVGAGRTSFGRGTRAAADLLFRAGGVQADDWPGPGPVMLNGPERCVPADANSTTTCGAGKRQKFREDRIMNMCRSIVNKNLVSRSRKQRFLTSWRAIIVVNALRGLEDRRLFQFCRLDHHLKWRNAAGRGSDADGTRYAQPYRLTPAKRPDAPSVPGRPKAAAGGFAFLICRRWPPPPARRS